MISWPRLGLFCVLPCLIFGELAAQDALNLSSSDASASVQADEAAAEQPNQSGDRFRFRFVDAPWPQVLEWVSAEAGLTLDLTDTPPGLFNYVDDRPRTVAEAIDVLNGYLLPRGFVLLRRDRFLVGIRTDNEVLPNLIPTVPAGELNQYGDNELLRITVPVEGFQLSEIAEQLNQILGPQGMASPIDSSDTLVLQGFGRGLRTAVSLLESAKAPPADDELIFRAFPLTHVPAIEAERQIQNLFGLGSNPFRASMQRREEYYRRRSNRRDDDDDRERSTQPNPLVQNVAMNMKVSALRHTNSLLVTATPAGIALVESMLQTIDVSNAKGEASEFADTTPQLRVYTVNNADEDDVAATIDAVIPGVVLNQDGRNNSIHVLATMTEHREVEELIRVIDSGGVGDGVEVIQLSRSDPYQMSELLESLFTNEDRDDRPVITPGLRTRSLIVRATSSQMAEIRKTLESFGEGAGVADSSGGRFRRVPVADGEQAKRLAEAVKMLLGQDVDFENQIRIVPSMHDKPSERTTSRDKNIRVKRLDQSAVSSDEDKVEIRMPFSQASAETTTRLATYTIRPEVGSQSNSQKPTPKQAASEPAPSDSPQVTIEIDGGDLLMYSDDPQALDRIESTIRELAEMMPSRTKWSVYFLKAAPADGTAQTLVDLLRANNSIDAFVGVGPEYESYGVGPQTMRIVPDARTNALFISGPDEQISQAEGFLKILDTTELPGSLRDRVPRAIPVQHAEAEAVAQIIRELYKDLMVDPTVARASRGGRDERDNDRRPVVTASEAKTPGLRPSGIQLTVAVDAVSNTLLVSCNDQIFEQIQQIVTQRDQAALQYAPVVEVLQLNPGNMYLLQSAFGEPDESSNPFNRPSSSSSRSSSSSNRRGNDRRR